MTLCSKWAGIGLVLLTVCGCGTSHPHEPDGGSVESGSPLCEAEFRTVQARLLCELALACEPRMADSLAAEQACHPGYRSVQRRVLDEGLESGATTYDAAVAATCVDELSNLVREVRCEEPAPACSQVYSGRVPAGGGCGYQTPIPQLSFECVPGLVCVVSVACPGECRALGGAGDACTTAFECGAALKCDAGRCVELAVAGEPCGAPPDCVPPLTCAAGLCASLPADGEPCADLLDCEAGLVCVPGSGGDGRCRPTGSLREGDDCYRFQFVPDPCPPPLACAATGGTPFGTCRLTAGLGSSCAEAIPCGHWARCVGGACTPIAPPEGDCSGGAVCPLTHWCDGARCRPLPIEGQACSPEGCFRSVCLLDGTCGFIGGRVGSGEVCDRVWQDCADGLECRTGDDAMPRCYPTC